MTSSSSLDARIIFLSVASFSLELCGLQLQYSSRHWFRYESDFMLPLSLSACTSTRTLLIQRTIKVGPIARLVNVRAKHHYILPAHGLTSRKRHSVLCHIANLCPRNRMMCPCGFLKCSIKQISDKNLPIYSTFGAIDFTERAVIPLCRHVVTCSTRKPCCRK